MWVKFIVYLNAVYGVWMTGLEYMCKPKIIWWTTLAIIHSSNFLLGSSLGRVLLRFLLRISSSLPRLSHHRVSGVLTQLWWLIALGEISLAFQLCIAYCCDIWFELQYCYSEKVRTLLTAWKLTNTNSSFVMLEIMSWDIHFILEAKFCVLCISVSKAVCGWKKKKVDP